jgi:predicted GNAT family N-acyltransferase
MQREMDTTLTPAAGDAGAITVRAATSDSLTASTISIKSGAELPSPIINDRRQPRRVRWGTSHVQRFLSRVVSGRCSIVETEAQMEKMFELRYRIYIQELKKNLPSADHERTRLPDPLDPGAAHFVVNRLSGQLVGCVRLHLGTAIPAQMLQAMQIADFVTRDNHRCGYVSKLMVERSLRGKGASVLMMMRMIEYGAAAGGQYALFHCNPKLVNLYERFGFRRFGQPFELPYVGTQVSMINLFGDSDHFANVGSPLACFVRRFRLPDDRLHFLRESFFLNRAAEIQS